MIDLQILLRLLRMKSILNCLQYLLDHSFILRQSAQLLQRMTLAKCDNVVVDAQEHENIYSLLAPVRDATVAIGFIPPAGRTEAKPAIFTGFGLQYNDQVYWVTAGHVLEEIDKAFAQVPEGRLFLKGLSSSSTATPYRREPSSWTDIGIILRTQASNGRLHISGQFVDPTILADMDVAVVRLGLLYTANLRAEGFRPLRFESIGLPSREELESFLDSGSEASYYIHGALAESVGRTSPHGDFSYDWKTLPINPTNFSQPRFEFEPMWKEDQHLDGIIGMSGGPVVLLGSRKARVVAVQSSQCRQGRKVKKLYGWDIQFVPQIIAALWERDHEGRTEAGRNLY